MHVLSNKTFDVIVLGGGPAGLGSALNLAEKGMTVLLLEKNRISQTEKTWLTFNYILEKYSLRECIRNQFSEIAFSCYLGSSFVFNNKDFIYPILGEKVLELISQRAQNKGAVIKENEPFIHYSVNETDSAVIVKTTKSKYRAKFIVDAMGQQSEILRSKGIGNETIYMGCLALSLESVNHKNDNKLLLYDSFFPGPDYFWLVPLEDDRMMAGVFFFNTLSEGNIKGKTEKLKFYIQAKGLGGKVCNTWMGNIPLGVQTNVNSDNFFFIGDNCNTALPSSGFSFNRCLEDSELLASFISQCYNNKLPFANYKKGILGKKIPGIEIHLIISDMLSNFTDPMLNKAIGEMNNLGEDFIISFLTGRDMSINFSINALKAILTTFSLQELSSLSLKQHHLKNLMTLYKLLPGLKSARIGEQLKDFVRSLIKPN